MGGEGPRGGLPGYQAGYRATGLPLGLPGGLPKSIIFIAFERRGRKNHYNLNGSKRATGQQNSHHGPRSQNSDTLLTSAYALRFEPIRHSSSGQKS